MRAGLPTLSLAIAVAAVTIIFAMRPFEALFHHWQFAVAAAVVGLALLAQGVAGVRPLDAQERFAALGGIGGALLCAAMVVAAFAVGPPHTLPGSPSQITPVRSGARLAVAFPEVTQVESGLTAAGSVELLNGGAPPLLLQDGDTRKIGIYVLRVSTGPIALVRATTPDGRPVTVTQPSAGAPFASPYLQFPIPAGQQADDYFAVPPLHRTVNVAYFASYHDPTKGVDIAVPFLLLQINEESGAPLYRGPAVSGRPVHQAGMVLTFTLGRYPVVMLASAPATTPLAIGILMIVAGLIGYAWTNLRAETLTPKKTDYDASAAN